MLDYVIGIDLNSLCTHFTAHDAISISKKINELLIDREEQ